MTDLNLIIPITLSLTGMLLLVIWGVIVLVGYIEDEIEWSRQRKAAKRYHHADKNR